MVCLAASIVTKHGKVLVSRQYVEMNRIRVEGLLAAFPKLVGTGKQHTYVETENVRYVYQPMEGLYLLLITNKQSNILQDLETLRLLSKVVREYVEDVTESYVAEHSFDLLFAFDEVISLGHKEEVTVAQVRQNTEMDSNEEKLVEMIKKAKIEETKQLMNMRARDIERERIERSQRGGSVPFSTTAMGSGPEMSGGGGGGGGGGSMAMDDLPRITPSAAAASHPTPAPPSRSGPSKGMKLSKDKKNELLSALDGDGAAASAGAALSAPSAPAPAAPTDPVNVSIQEKLTVKMNKEGGLQAMEVQGVLELLCTDAAAACVQVVLALGANAGFQFKTHPNIDKALYASQQRLGVKDPARPFPLDVPQGVLKWRFQTTDEARVPISINSWPTPSGAETYLNIEYESSATYDLQQVVISIPGVYSAPNVNSCDGDWRYDSSQHCVLWTIDLVDDSNRSGSMEVVVATAAPESFFPCTVSFTAQESVCDIRVPQCVNAQSQAPTRFGLKKQLAVSSFEVLH